MGIFNTTTSAFGGVSPPNYFSGKSYLPHWAATLKDTSVTVTATRIYYIPIFVWQNQTFSGVKCSNSGTGDNGKKISLGIYTMSASGGPGTRLVNCAEITLSGAAALRTAAGSVALTAGNWYYIAFQSDTAPAMYMMSSSAQISAAGIVPQTYQQFFGEFSAGLNITANANATFGLVDYVNATYVAGSFASTAVAPTFNGYTVAAPLGDNLCPAVWLYL